MVMKKKLIETSLPLEVINAESAREKSIRHGHPSTLHLYWARRPLAAARSVLFAQLVDDPASRPEEFPTRAEQDAERARLHALMERLAKWENTTDEALFKEAREEIRKSNGGTLPPVLDPFAGGGSIPLEAQRLGLEAHASDLNPLAVLINKALIEIPPNFAGMMPVFPDAAGERTGWAKAEGLAEDIRRYGQWMRDTAEQRIGHLYPTVKGDCGQEHTVIAWIWARTVKSPNPANPIEVPLVRSWWLSKKKGKEAWVEATVTDGAVQYRVRHDAEGPRGDADGTVDRRGAISIADGTPIDLKYIRSEARAGRMGAHLIGVVADTPTGRLYVSPSEEHVLQAQVAKPQDTPDALLPSAALGFRVQAYGFKKWADLFTNRQLVALTTLSDLVAEARAKVLHDAMAAGMERGARLEEGGTGAEAYADALAQYLALTVDRIVMSCNAFCRWNSTGEKVQHIFGRQAIPMIWDFAEANPLGTRTGSMDAAISQTLNSLIWLPLARSANVNLMNAMKGIYDGYVVSTDPPYYDNIGYADLSDFFYVWLRRSLHDVEPAVCATMLTPKSEELVANQYRHDGKEGAKKFFVAGFNEVFKRIRVGANPNVPMTVYYAYKQQDSKADGDSSTGWYTLLDGLIGAGWQITATWPLRTEMRTRMVARDTNSLASSIVLACRPRPEDAPATTKRSFAAELKRELPPALRTLMQGSIAPVDLAQAAIGPGISVFSKYSRVREASGQDMSVRDALILINETLDEVLGEQETDYDPDTRFAVKWYRQYGWGQESSGIADQLARSSDTSIGALERGGIFEAKGGKACLLAPSSLDSTWDPAGDDRISVWEATIRLAATMAKDGADRVAQLLPAVGNRVNLGAVKELGFRLFHEAEKNGDTNDAVLFNGLVSAWGDVVADARTYASRPQTAQETLDFGEY
jgi:putative DNA methylase